jgi:hypothetical protein
MLDRPLASLWSIRTPFLKLVLAVGGELRLKPPRDLGADLVARGVGVGHRQLMRTRAGGPRS